MYVVNTKQVQKRLFQLNWRWPGKNKNVSYLDFPILFLRDNKKLYAARTNGDKINFVDGYIFTEKEFFKMFGELEIILVDWDKAYKHMKEGGIAKYNSCEYTIGTNGYLIRRFEGENEWSNAERSINFYLQAQWELL